MIVGWNLTNEDLKQASWEITAEELILDAALRNLNARPFIHTNNFGRIATHRRVALGI